MQRENSRGRSRKQREPTLQLHLGNLHILGRPKAFKSKILALKCDQINKLTNNLCSFMHFTDWHRFHPEAPTAFLCVQSGEQLFYRHDQSQLNPTTCRGWTLFHCHLSTSAHPGAPPAQHSAARDPQKNNPRKLPFFSLFK